MNNFIKRSLLTGVAVLALGLFNGKPAGASRSSQRPLNGSARLLKGYRERYHTNRNPFMPAERTDHYDLYLNGDHQLWSRPEHDGVPIVSRSGAHRLADQFVPFRGVSWKRHYVRDAYDPYFLVKSRKPSYIGWINTDGLYKYALRRQVNKDLKYYNRYNRNYKRKRSHHRSIRRHGYRRHGRRKAETKWVSPEYRLQQKYENQQVARNRPINDSVIKGPIRHGYRNYLTGYRALLSRPARGRGTVHITSLNGARALAKNYVPFRILRSLNTYNQTKTYGNTYYLIESVPWNNNKWTGWVSNTGLYGFGSREKVSRTLNSAE